MEAFRRQTGGGGSGRAAAAAAAAAAKRFSDGYGDPADVEAFRRQTEGGSGRAAAVAAALRIADGSGDPSTAGGVTTGFDGCLPVFRYRAVHPPLGGRAGGRASSPVPSAFIFPHTHPTLPPVEPFWRTISDPHYRLPPLRLTYPCPTEIPPVRTDTHPTLQPMLFPVSPRWSRDTPLGPARPCTVASCR